MYRAMPMLTPQQKRRKKYQETSLKAILNQFLQQIAIN
jgi:hypothetical protein